MRRWPGWLGLVLALGCATGAARSETVTVIAGGWHTELALPRDALAGELTALAPRFPGARYLVFGWGARDFYMARDPDLGDVLRAMTPGPAVVLIAPLGVPPEAWVGPRNSVVLPITAAGGTALSSYLWAALAKDPQGAPRPIAAGPYAGSLFYAGTGTYDLAHTCNTWTAEALRAAGLPVTARGVVTKNDIVDQLPRLAAR
jgi:uncharacterized protein (TIGR02117 family)